MRRLLHDRVPAHRLAGRWRCQNGALPFRAACSSASVGSATFFADVGRDRRFSSEFAEVEQRSQIAGSVLTQAGPPAAPADRTRSLRHGICTDSSVTRWRSAANASLALSSFAVACDCPEYSRHIRPLVHLRDPNSGSPQTTSWSRARDNPTYNRCVHSVPEPAPLSLNHEDDSAPLRSVVEAKGDVTVEDLIGVPPSCPSTFDTLRLAGVPIAGASSGCRLLVVE